MPAPPWPTTAARSCCSIRRASPSAPASTSPRASSTAPLHADAAEAEAARETSLLLFRTLDGAPPRGSGRAGRADRGRRRPTRSASAPASCGVSIGERILPLAGCAAAPEPKASCASCGSPTATTEIAYGFAEVIDIRSLVLELQPAPAPGEVAGVVLIDGAQVELLDPHWLFAAACATPAPTRPRRRSARCPRAIPGSTICCGR